jgi:hypothetical protein
LGTGVCELMPSRLNSGRLMDQPAGSFEDDDADSGGEAEHAAGEQHVPRPNPGLLEQEGLFGHRDDGGKNGETSRQREPVEGNDEDEYS